MREKLKILSEILKQNTDIKDRLERLEFGCWVQHTHTWNFHRFISFDYGGYGIRIWTENITVRSEILKVIGREPQYSDILEYLRDTWSTSYYLRLDWIYALKRSEFSENEYREKVISLSPWPLSNQSDSTLDEIISLCKNVWK